MPRPEAMDDFILGLIAGEGSFYVNARLDDAYTTGINLRPGFGVQMRDMEKKLLHICQDHVGAGSVRSVRERRGNRKPTIAWKADSLKECLKLRNWMDRALRSKTPNSHLFQLSSKWDSWVKWEKVVALMDHGFHDDPEVVMEILELREEMNDDTRGRSMGEIIEESRLPPPVEA